MSLLMRQQPQHGDDKLGGSATLVGQTDGDDTRTLTTQLRPDPDLNTVLTTTFKKNINTPKQAFLSRKQEPKCPRFNSRMRILIVCTTLPSLRMKIDEK